MLVGRGGFEPPTNWLRVNCSTDWANDPTERIILFYQDDVKRLSLLFLPLFSCIFVKLITSKNGIIPATFKDIWLINTQLSTM